MAPKKVQPQGAQTLEQVEAKFAAQTTGFYEKCMDLNTPQSVVGSAANQLLALRSTLLGLYGVAPDPKWSPGAAAAQGAVAGSAGGDVQWKQKLNECAAKKAARPLAKGEFVYTTTAVDETNKSFTSTVSGSLLSKKYSSVEPQISKKLAEQTAARAALQAEYPEAYTELAAHEVALAPAKGEKRKSDPLPMGDKNELNHMMQMLLSRSVTKDDVLYTLTTIEGEKPSYSATVSLPTYEGSPTFQGAPASAKKDAEAAAAKVAIAAFKDAAAPLIEEHKAKKARKNAEDMEKMKQKHAEKQAAGITA
mmetsp:Transcript_100935/g.256813  ORF Transcript_100935/g.256813 Transcript_100935/m.256813 type:complete len:307 (+) Transcript_100935:78-998(+)